MKPSTLIAHDHPLFASGLERLLAPHFDIVDTLHELPSLPDAVRRLQPEVVVQCLSATPSVGLDIISLIHRSMPDTRIVVVTMWAEGGLAADALRRGASAYIHQSATAAELLAGIRAALSRQPYVIAHVATAARDSWVETGEPILTPRQCEVVRLLAQGKSMKEVGNALSMSPRTVAFHKYGAMARFSIKNSAELVCFALTRGLV